MTTSQITSELHEDDVAAIVVPMNYGFDALTARLRGRVQVSEPGDGRAHVGHQEQAYRPRCGLELFLGDALGDGMQGFDGDRDLGRAFMVAIRHLEQDGLVWVGLSAVQRRADHRQLGFADGHRQPDAQLQLAAPGQQALQSLEP